MNDKSDAPPELTAYRETLDRLDAALVYLLAERFTVTERIGQLKSQLNVPPLDARREQAQVERLREIAMAAGLNPDYAERVFLTVTTVVRERHEEIRRRPEPRR
ncbi:MAG: chorismate mutase [Alkalispirochaeta sp.]